MKKIARFLLVAVALLSPVSQSFASDTGGMGIDATINKVLTPVAKFLSAVVFFKVNIAGSEVLLVVVWLMLGAIFCTLYLGWIQVRGFKHAIRLVKGDYAPVKGVGEISAFNALCTAISGTVGIGNIAGVPIAISIGGPGAVFWMLAAGFLGMATKFTECALATMFRKVNSDGSISGGPMYYLEQGLKERGFPRVGRFVGRFYAFGIVIGCLGIGNMFQSNQAYEQFLVVTGGEASIFADKGWLFGLAFASLVFAVIVGGIKSIGNVAGKLVPVMAITYIATAIVVIVMNANLLGQVVQLALDSAFTGDAAAGGIVGAMMVGFQRAVFSNEAGLGSAAIAHAAVKTDNPITEGYVSLLEPFIDTLIVLSLTATVVLIGWIKIPGFAEALSGGMSGMAASSRAYARHLPFAPYLLAAAGMMFALSTALAWAYYGLKGWTYLFGEGKNGKLFFNIMYCLFFALGSAVQLGALMDISDALVFLICVPNIFGLFMLAHYVKAQLLSYETALRGGEIVSGAKE